MLIRCGVVEFPSLKTNAAFEPSTTFADAKAGLSWAPDTFTVCPGANRSASAMAANKRRASSDSSRAGAAQDRDEFLPRGMRTHHTRRQPSLVRKTPRLSLDCAQRAVGSIGVWAEARTWAWPAPA